MAPRRLGPHDLASALPPGGRTLVAGCSGESLLLAEAVMRAGERLGAMTFTGIFVPGLNTRTYLANPNCRVETFFLTPELKAAGDAVAFLPLVLWRHSRPAADPSRSMPRCSWRRRPTRTALAASGRSSIFSLTSGRKSRSASRISILVCRTRRRLRAGIPLPST